MKTIVLALLLASTGGLVQAQEGKTGAEKSNKTGHAGKTEQKESPETRAVKALRMMTAKLGLTEQQQVDVKPVLVERETAKEKARSAYKDQSDELKQALKEAGQAADVKLKTILTAEQWKTLEEVRKDEKQRHGERKGDKKPGSPSNKRTPEKSAD